MSVWPHLASTWCTAGTGKREKVTIKAETGRLSQEDIERMVKEAQEFAEQVMAVCGDPFHCGSDGLAGWLDHLSELHGLQARGSVREERQGRNEVKRAQARVSCFKVTALTRYHMTCVLS